MVKSQELLKEIEELRENYFQGISERRKEEKKIYEEKKIEIERWRKLREEGKETVFPIERITELKKKGEEETEKTDRAIKDKMLNDLSSWALDPEGFFYRVNGVLKDIGTTEYTYDTIHFYNRNYRNEIVNGFIEEIKQNPQDWKIWKAKPEEVIVANGRSFNYCPCKVVEHKSGRRHYKSEECGEQVLSFLPEEWAEIENILNYQKSNSKELEERKNELEEDKNSKNIYYGMGAISLILVVISVTAVVWLKKKK